LCALDAKHGFTLKETDLKFLVQKSFGYPSGFQPLQCIDKIISVYFKPCW
jgi:hypothetical protein